jgi:cytidylate kinase
VWVAAPLEYRIGNLVSRDGISRNEAERRIKQSDPSRQAFHRHYFKVEPDSPHLYDLGINAERIPVDVAAKLIAVAVQAKMPRPG